jgi:hypothetical protein
MDHASGQLSALARLHVLFDEAGIAYWLFGGWAVDFYAGSITRAHDDIDIAVWVDDLPRIDELIAADGWLHVPSPEDDGGTGYERAGVRVELTYLAREGNGEIYIPLRRGRATWSSEALGNDVRELFGMPARVISLESLKHGKASPRDDPEEAAKDSADFRALSEL